MPVVLYAVQKWTSIILVSANILHHYLPPALSYPVIAICLTLKIFLGENSSKGMLENWLVSVSPPFLPIRYQLQVLHASS